MLHSVTPSPSAAGILTALTVFAMTGCDRPIEKRRTGQELISAVAANERSDEPARQEYGQAGREAIDVLGNSADRVVNASNDLAITAAVNAKLAGSSQMSALAVKIDTSSGRVVLRGAVLPTLRHKAALANWRAASRAWLRSKTT